MGISLRKGDLNVVALAHLSYAMSFQMFENVQNAIPHPHKPFSEILVEIEDIMEIYE